MINPPQPGKSGLLARVATIDRQQISVKFKTNISQVQHKYRRSFFTTKCNLLNPRLTMEIQEVMVLQIGGIRSLIHNTRSLGAPTSWRLVSTGWHYIIVFVLVCVSLCLCMLQCYRCSAVARLTLLSQTTCSNNL